MAAPFHDDRATRLDYVRGFCSVACHDRSFVDRLDGIRGPAAKRWWRRMRERSHRLADPKGPPPCTCKVTRSERGLMKLERAPDCPWGTYCEDSRRYHNAIETAYFAVWKDLPVGSIVRGRLYEHGRRTVALPRLIETSGGFLYAVVPVERCRPYPRLRDLDLDIRSS